MGLFDRAVAEKSGAQSEDQQKLAAHVRSKVEEIRGSANRIAHEGIWMTNIAYLLGYDGIVFNSATRQFQPVNRGGSYLKRNRIHVNKILPTLQNRAARLCKNQPRYDVRPESNDTSDKEAARLGVQVIGAYWDKLKLSEKRIPLIMWVQECGHAYMNVGWDADGGQLMQDPVTGEWEWEGDIGANIYSPFEVFPDPLAKSFDEALKTWVITAKVRKLEYFKTRYPGVGDLVKEEEVWLMSNQYEQRINSLNSRGPSSGGTAFATKNCAIELVKYEAPTREHPKGRMIIVANGIVLEDKDLPVGEIPFAKFDDVVIGGKYYSEAVLTHLRPVQDQYNTTIRKRAEWLNKFLSGKYKAARGMGLSQESINDSDSEIVYYDHMPGTNGPEPIQVPTIPQWAYAEEERLDAQINDISGIGEVSRGTLPAAGIPAIGMQLLTEQDDTRIGIITEQHEHAWARVGSLILKHFQEFVTFPRKLKIAGSNLSYTVKEIKGDDIKENTDVIVIRGSLTPGSKTLRRQEIINAYQQGLLGDQTDPRVREKVLAAMEFGDTAEMWQDYGLDMSQIKKGIDILESGSTPVYSEFDNHALWIQELNRYRKGDKWDKLNPKIQENFLLCIETHVQGLMQMTGTMPPPVDEDMGLPAQPAPPEGAPV